MGAINQIDVELVPEKKKPGNRQSLETSTRSGGLTSASGRSAVPQWLLAAVEQSTDSAVLSRPVEAVRKPQRLGTVNGDHFHSCLFVQFGGMESAEDRLESFYAALRNLDRLEHEDFREIIKSQFRPTLRERYLTVNYHRAAFNVEMMLAIKDTKQFQTLSLLSRTIFELAVEIKSIIRDADSAKKIELF